MQTKQASGAKPLLASGKLPGLMAPSMSSLRSHHHVANSGNFTKAGTLHTINWPIKINTRRRMKEKEKNRPKETENQHEQI